MRKLRPPRPDLTEGFSPNYPNPVATAKVTCPLPVPCTCRYCGAPVEVVHNSKIYREALGDWPWVYACTHCKAWVGMHPGTAIPLGTLADQGLRLARAQAKAKFNDLWRGCAIKQRYQMTRTQAYRWLASELGIEPAECHFGWFDTDYCLLAQAFCDYYMERIK